MKEKAFRTQIRKIEIYLIHSPETGEVVIGKCREPNSYQAYKDHVRMQKPLSKSFFEGVRSRGIYPKMYLLERLETTEVIAYGHVVAWTKYFSDAGYKVLTYEKTLAYANDLTDKNRQIYEQICTIPMEEILAEDRILVGSYTPRPAKDPDHPKAPHHISMCVTPEEYEVIRCRAEAKNMTISVYCRERVRKGGMIHIDLSEDIEDIRLCRMELRAIKDKIRRTGEYTAEDIARIQELVDDLIDRQKTMFERQFKIIEDIGKQNR